MVRYEALDMINALAALSAALYTVATWQLMQRFRAEAAPPRDTEARNPPGTAPNPALWILPALLLHGVVLYHDVLSPEGFNLGFFNAASLTAWTVATLMTLASFRRPLDNLGMLIWPLAALAVVLAVLFPEARILGPEVGLGVRIHVVFSILAYSLLAIAACQAIFLYILEYHLRHKRAGVILRILPPLQIQEILLLQLVGLGFFLLSLSLISGVVFVNDFLAQHLVHKTILSVVAWAIFGWVLWGRWRYGWRGRTLIRLCLIGFALLVLAYFGSKLVLEVILGRNWTGTAPSG